MSGTHRPFSDGAGYTRHCWECANATGWGQSCGSRVYNATSTPNPFVHLLNRRKRDRQVRQPEQPVPGRGWLHGVQEGKVTEEEWRDLATKPIGTVVRK